MSKTFGQFRQSDPLITHFHLPEQESLPILYCDMDGVLCDFELGIEKMFQLKSKDPSMPGPMQTIGFSNAKEWLKAPMSADKWAPVQDYGLFWPTLPWKKDGRTLWNYIKKFNPHILSAYSPFDKNSRLGKTKWIERNLNIKDKGRIHLVRRAEKKIYAKGAVLIDDYGRNIKDWKSNGGIPVKHKTASDTISQLKKLGF